MEDLEETLEHIENLQDIIMNPEFQEVHNLIRSFSKDLKSVEINFKRAMRDLNGLLTNGVINETIYSKCVHIINSQLVIYINEENPKSLIYKCPVCEGYFLEKKDQYLIEKIHPFHIKKELPYVSYEICSESCLKNQKNLKLADRIVDDPK